MLKLTGSQIIGIAIVAVSVLAVSSSQLTILFGQVSADKIVAGAVIINGMLGGIGALIGGRPAQNVQIKQVLDSPGGQAALVREVLAMPGIDKVDVNAKANKDLAQVAVDPKQDKISPTLDAQAIVEATAKG